MTTLTRWDPYSEMQNMRGMMERFFGDPVNGFGIASWPRGDLNLALDVAEDKDGFIVKASIPGVKPEEIEVSVVNNVLTIRGEMHEDQEIKEENYHMRERRFGSYSRSVTLPNTVEADKIDASYDHGVLTLHLPKAESVKPRKIVVHSTVDGNGK